MRYPVDTDWVADLLIAATALERDLTLLTRNQRHFARNPRSEALLTRSSPDSGSREKYAGSRHPPSGGPIGPRQDPAGRSPLEGKGALAGPLRKLLERKTGFEPATLTLAR
jgi:hypothetical protein